MERAKGFLDVSTGIHADVEHAIVVGRGLLDLVPEIDEDDVPSERSDPRTFNEVTVAVSSQQTTVSAARKQILRRQIPFFI